MLLGRTEEMNISNMDLMAGELWAWEDTSRKDYILTDNLIANPI